MALSIDVEDWFQVENLKGMIPRSTWTDRELRVERNTERLLEILARTETRATFFCLGWIAERVPMLVRRIVAAGHELASHGYDHELVYEIGPERFRSDVRSAKARLEDTAGVPVDGYRAPSFSITDWALEILLAEGYRYDSSFFPSPTHDRYAKLELEALRPGGMRIEAAGQRAAGKSASGESVAAAPTWPPAVVQLANGMLEVPINTWHVAGRTWPWGGGGYFRIVPGALFRFGWPRAAAQHGGAVFYLHPWEVDPGQPHIDGLPRSYRFRHYVNLHRTADRLERLCRAYRFDTVARLIELVPAG